LVDISVKPGLLILIKWGDGTHYFEKKKLDENIYFAKKKNES
jgi:hypothetical protein